MKLFIDDHEYFARPGESLYDMVKALGLKSDRLSRLLELQDAISKEKNMSYVGKTVRVLVDGESRRKRFTALNARTYSNKLVHFEGDASLIGSFAEVEITSADSYNLIGKLK